MDQIHHSTGIIKYDPYRGVKTSRSNWWCVVNVDREITRYYRWWLKRELHIHLYQPSWDAHISIVRGESVCSKRPLIWNKYNNEHVDFLYDATEIMSSPDPDGGHFYWIAVECPKLGEIRKELGLPTGWRFHLTIGRTYE